MWQWITVSDAVRIRPSHQSFWKYSIFAIKIDRAVTTTITKQDEIHYRGSPFGSSHRLYDSWPLCSYPDAFGGWIRNDGWRRQDQSQGEAFWTPSRRNLRSITDSNIVTCFAQIDLDSPKVATMDEIEKGKKVYCRCWLSGKFSELYCW